LTGDEAADLAPRHATGVFHHIGRSLVVTLQHFSTAVTEAEALRLTRDHLVRRCYDAQLVLERWDVPVTQSRSDPR